MKNLSNRALLILGILIATLTLVNHWSLANTKSMVELEKEQKQLVAALVDEIEMETNILSTVNSLYKIYNADNKLVYETRNSEDQKLKNLLNKSDLLTTIDNISYFKLSR